MIENDFIKTVSEIIKNNEENKKDDRTIPLLKLLVNNGSAINELYEELMEDCPF